VVIGEDVEDDVAVGKCWSCRGLRVEGPMGGRAHGYKTDLSHALVVLLLVGFHFFKFVAKAIAPLHGSGVDLFKKAQMQCRMCSKAQEGFVMSCSSRFCFCVFQKDFHISHARVYCVSKDWHPLLMREGPAPNQPRIQLMTCKDPTEISVGKEIERTALLQTILSMS
jgi:hypothetical protein